MNPDTTNTHKADRRVVLLEGIHASAVEALQREGYTDIVTHAQALSGQALLDAVTDARLLGIRSRTQLSSDVLHHAQHLMAVGCYCIGTNQVDLEEAMRLGIPVFNAPFSNTRSVAELVLAEAILLLRGVPEKNAVAHRGGWLKSAENAYEIRGKTLGIVGYGHIGTQIGILAEGLGMQVVFYDIETKLPLGNARQLPSLEALLGVADVVTKSVGTSNPYNMIRATFDALTDQTSPKSVAQRRGKQVADLLGRGGASVAEAEAAADAIVE